MTNRLALGMLVAHTHCGPIFVKATPNLDQQTENECSKH